MSPSVGSETLKNNNRLQVDNEIEHDQFEVSIETSKSSYANAVFKSFTGFAKDMKVLYKEKVFVVNVLGYVSYNFVIGAYSYWGPKAGYNIYKMKNADMIFGAVTIICGIVGTLSGGFILDRVTATIPNAFKLLSGATFLGAVFCFTAFTLKSLYGFIALFALGELLVFATQLVFLPSGSCKLCVFALCETKFTTIINGYIHRRNSHIRRCSFFASCRYRSGSYQQLEKNHTDSYIDSVLSCCNMVYSVDRFNQEETGSENPRRPELSSRTP
jgi:uncharacterized membrane protein YeaQ/YmgE (transglycosylase-associated protein family)